MATREITPLIQVSAMTVCKDWLRQGSSRWPPSLGQLELRTNVETYLHDGDFDQDRMLDAFEQFANGNAKGGFLFDNV
jgi:hypothetical protein